MSNELLTGCALGLSADDLSAWRDGALDAAAKARLDAHIAGCAACRARLAEYDAIAQGLRAIPTPEPAHGYGRNPRAASATTTNWPRPVRRAPIGRRRTLGRLGAIAAVALLLLAFTQVFGRLGIQSPPATATKSPTSLATATAAATATPSEATLPTFQFVSAASAWGNTGLVAHIASTQINASENFVPSALLPDGSALVGQIYHYANGSAQLALWNIATGKVTPLNAPGSSMPFGGIMTDGRYVVYQGATNCQCLTVYDLRASAIVRQIGISYDAAPAYFDHGIYIQQYLGGGIFTINVATGQESAFPGASVATQQPLLLAFSWPYVVYMPDQSATTLSGALAVRDLATGQSANLTPLIPLLPDLLSRLKNAPNPGVTVTAGALFVVTASQRKSDSTVSQPPVTTYINQLYELDNFMGAAPTLKPIARVESQFQDRVVLRGVNTRVLGMMIGAPPTAYDRATGKAVQFSIMGLGTVVTGHFVVAMGPLNGHELGPYEVIIYDTNRLPGG